MNALHRYPLGGALVIAWMLTINVAELSALARKKCPMSCREEAAHCDETRCAGLRSKERRTCREACRGRSGCPAAIRTLAYVVSECREVPGRQALVGRQALLVRRGNCDPVTVMDIIAAETVPDPLRICRIFVQNRY